MERLVSVSGDGCVFVWRLPEDLAMEIKAAAAQVAAARAPGLRRRLTAADAVAAGEVVPPVEAAVEAEPSPAVAEGDAVALAATPPEHSSRRWDESPAATNRGAAASPAASPARGRSSSGGRLDSIGQTIRRVLAGRPLVPKDKLPAWAASQVSPSPSPTKKQRAAAAATALASEGGASATEEPPVERPGAGPARGLGLGASYKAAAGKWARTMSTRGPSMLDDQLIATAVGALEEQQCAPPGGGPAAAFDVVANVVGGDEEEGGEAEEERTAQLDDGRGIDAMAEGLPGSAAEMELGRLAQAAAQQGVEEGAAGAGAAQGGLPPADTGVCASSDGGFKQTPAGSLFPYFTLLIRSVSTHSPTINLQPTTTNPQTTQVPPLPPRRPSSATSSSATSTPWVPP